MRCLAATVISDDPYVFVAVGTGVLIALVAWLPIALKKLPLSLPIICIALGTVVFHLPRVSLVPLPQLYPAVVERLTEFVLIVALMGAGLKIDRIIGRRRWAVTWHLLGATMPLGILAVTGLAVWILALPWPIALLLGACLAPTDPVLAADVQVGPPRSGEDDEVRFGLTSEAGLNDGAAFPFVHLAVLLAAAGSIGTVEFAEWLALQVFWAIAGGVASGWLVGRLFGWLTFRASIRHQLSRTGDGLIALSATLVSYGAAQAVQAYGFVAVFVTALTIRHTHREHAFQSSMHTVIEQVERLVLMVFLILFGGSLASGLLAGTTWLDAAFAAAIILIVRPLTGWLGLMGFSANRSEKLMLAFFGIRGVGSVYYMAYAANHVALPGSDRLWAVVGLVILFSVVLHGFTASTLMRLLDRQQGRKSAT